MASSSATGDPMVHACHDRGGLGSSGLAGVHTEARYGDPSKPGRCSISARASRRRPGPSACSSMAPLRVAARRGRRERLRPGCLGGRARPTASNSARGSARSSAMTHRSTTRGSVRSRCPSSRPRISSSSSLWQFPSSADCTRETSRATGCAWASFVAGAGGATSPCLGVLSTW